MEASADAANLTGNALASVLEFVIECGQLTHMPALQSKLQSVVEPLTITGIASGYVTGPRAASLQPFHFNTWPASWLQRYTEGSFLLDDPLPRWVRSSGRAVTWSALFKILPPRDPGRRVIRAAKEFGFHEGVTIPMRADNGALGLVAFATSRKHISAAEQAFLTIVGRAAFEAAERIEGLTGKPAPIMTEREIACLGLLVHGHSDKQISRMLGISEPTVRFHLGNARTKCRASSRTHMAVLAVQQGLVSY
jgi:DNA-binding CsgD family transcriptional regulator